MNFSRKFEFEFTEIIVWGRSHWKLICTYLLSLITTFRSSHYFPMYSTQENSDKNTLMVENKQISGVDY